MGCISTKEEREFQNQSDVPFWVRIQERERILEHNQAIFEGIRGKGEEQMIDWKRNSETQQMLLRYACGRLHGREMNLKER